jgi:predicted nucleic acid-binding protein
MDPESLSYPEFLRHYPTSALLLQYCLHTGIFLSSQGAAEEERIMSLVDHLTLIHPDQGFPGLYGEAAAALIRQGTPIPVMDLLIGISAKSKGLPILTRDPAHVSRIPGLIVESY